jgi:hypothetical protein
MRELNVKVLAALNDAENIEHHAKLRLVLVGYVACVLWRNSLKRKKARFLERD